MPRSILTYNVNPDILKWARETCGINIEKMAKRYNKTVDEFKEYENGTKRFTISQLYRLANYYKRPVVIFYLDEIPQEVDLPDLRTFKYKPEEINTINKSLNYHIRKILTKKKKMEHLANLVGFIPDYSFLNEIGLSSDYSEIAKIIRRIFQIKTKDYIKLKDNSVLKYWIAKIEKKNILVFQYPYIELKISRGFAFSTLPFPTIGLNQRDLHYPRIFTLIHELCHIFYHENGLCDTKILSNRNQNIEIKCNKIAAEVLLPNQELSYFYSKLKDKSDWKSIIQKISSNFKVSYSVAIFRLKNLNIVPDSKFNHLHNWVIKRDKPIRSKTSGGNFYSRELNSTSNLFLNVLIDALDQNKINYSEALKISGYKKSDTFDNIYKKVIFGGI